jgi:pseudaminic acid cytidylyltransferase
MVIAVIPARGGSKRIPRKNIKNFCGKPILTYSIDAAFKSKCFDRVVVSTDDSEIADIAIKLGAEVPYIRSAELSDDYAGTNAVMCDAMQWFEKNGELPDLACCIYATAPFISTTSLNDGLNIMMSLKYDYAFTISEFSSPIQRALRINNNGIVEMLDPELYETRSQDLEQAFHDAGQFYWGRTEAWLSKKKILSSNSCPIQLPRHQVQDIDTLEDWEYAEKMFQIFTAAERD